LICHLEGGAKVGVPLERISEAMAKEVKPFGN
jgi:hypothetical protein